jgi:hypothetical protein
VTVPRSSIRETHAAPVEPCHGRRDCLSARAGARVNQVIIALSLRARAACPVAASPPRRRRLVPSFLNCFQSLFELFFSHFFLKFFSPNFVAVSLPLQACFGTLGGGRSFFPAHYSSVLSGFCAIPGKGGVSDSSSVTCHKSQARVNSQRLTRHQSSSIPGVDSQSIQGIQRPLPLLRHRNK